MYGETVSDAMTRPGIPLLMLGPYLRTILSVCVAMSVIASVWLFVSANFVCLLTLKDCLIKAAVSAVVWLFVAGLLYLVLHLMGMP